MNAEEMYSIDELNKHIRNAWKAVLWYQGLKRQIEADDAQGGIDPFTHEDIIYESYEERKAFLQIFESQFNSAVIAANKTLSRGKPQDNGSEEE